MDAFNLSVVLSPNLLPMSLANLTPNGGSTSGVGGGSRKQRLPLALSEDSILAANIDILQVKWWRSLELLLV